MSTKLIFNTGTVKYQMIEFSPITFNTPVTAMNKPAEDHKERLLNALTVCLETKTYRDITLADITRVAQVSRRSFYQHFANKDECLLALSADTGGRLMACILSSFSAEDHWNTLTTKVTQAYLSFIQKHPALMHALYVETATMGAEGLMARRRIAETFALFLCQQVTIRMKAGEALREIDHATAIALVAGINELILYELMDGKAASLMLLQETAEKIIQRSVNNYSAA